MLLVAALWGASLLPAQADVVYRIRQVAWTDADERGYGEFIAAIGASGCNDVDACLHDAANMFAAADPPGTRFRSDCADLPYVLRFYYAWHRGLPFSYVSSVSPRGRAHDIRYSASGNIVEERSDVADGADALAVLERLRDDVSSATYRIHPARTDGDEGDFYSPALTPRAIHPGTTIYDPNGHLAIVWRVEPDGRIRYIDAHPDNSLSRGTYDQRFVRSAPGLGAGFKNWRPLGLERGRAVLARNEQISDFSVTQFYGNSYGTGARPDDADWRAGRFVLNGAVLDYYDYLRASLAGGRLRFDPLAEVRDMVRSNCADLSYRMQAVTLGLAAGLQNQSEPDRLPDNIYGTQGDWEDYSTPSRDARLKTAFKEVRDIAARFLMMNRAHDPRLTYAGGDLAGDMLAVYDQAASDCALSYQRSDGSRVLFGYEDARRRLFRLSFDPYHCVERRWGAAGDELDTCRDGAVKHAWYMAEQALRNQLDRTYEAQMDWSLRDLQRGWSVGDSRSDQNKPIGVAEPPDTDVRSFLLAQKKTAAL